MKKIKLEFTPIQMDAFISLIATIESMHGCSDTESSDDALDFDTETIKDIKNIDRMFSMNGYKRK